MLAVHPSVNYAQWAPSQAEIPRGRRTRLNVVAYLLLPESRLP
jgi:hypothetical protein